MKKKVWLEIPNTMRKLRKMSCTLVTESKRNLKPVFKLKARVKYFLLNQAQINGYVKQCSNNMQKMGAAFPIYFVQDEGQKIKCLEERKSEESLCN